MKIFVFTDERGNITGSFLPKESPGAGAPSFKPRGRSKGLVHEIELSGALAQIKDPTRLHEELQKLVPVLVARS